MPPAQQRCDGGLTRWWAQGLEGQQVFQGAWEVLKLGLSVHRVTVPWSHHTGMGCSPPSRSSRILRIAISCIASAKAPGAFPD